MSISHVFAQTLDFLAQQQNDPLDGLDPAPTPPPGPLKQGAQTLLSWIKWGGLFGAVVAGVAAGIMMAIGRRNRNNMAIEGAISIPWIIGGIALILGSASLVTWFVSPPR
jgi:predicted lipid-binding transport protein (Tim44 family)